MKDAIDKYKERFISQYGQVAWDAMMDKNRQAAEIAMRKFLSDEKGTITFPNYVMELKRWADNMSHDLFKQKVRRVHSRCMRTGRFNLANRIYSKYSRYFISNNDLVMAFGMSLSARKK